MKKELVATLIAMSIMFVGCNSKDSETSISSDSSTTQTNITTVSESVLQPEVKEIEVGSFGNTPYTLTIMGNDNTIYTYSGTTNMFTLLDLCDEIARNCTEFTYTVENNSFKSLREQEAKDGYFATYINGRYIDDITAVTQNTMIGDPYEVVIKYVTDNIFFNDADCKIPAVEDIYTITIMDFTDPVVTETYTFYQDNGIEYTYSIEKIDTQPLSYSEGTDKVSVDDFNSLKQVVLGLDDVKILGLNMPTQEDHRYKYMIMVNSYLCLTDSVTITEYLNNIPKPEVHDKQA